jgi:hypothetical protein
LDFLSLKNYVNVPSNSTVKCRKTFFLNYFFGILEVNDENSRIVSGSGSEYGSGFISLRLGSADPDPHQNITDTQHCQEGTQPFSQRVRKTERVQETNITLGMLKLELLLAVSNGEGGGTKILGNELKEESHENLIFVR